MTALGEAARRLLDEVQGLAQLDALDAEGFAARLDETGEAATLAELEARPDELAAVLPAIDAFAGRAMRLRLGPALASDTTLAPQFRTYLASMVTAYDGDL